MSAEYSVEEVRDMAKAMKVASCVSFHPDYAKDPEHRVWSGDASNMLTAYANRIEADERAVPDFWCAVHVGTGEVGLCMSSNDANGGEAARTEVNDWINDDLQENPQNNWSIKPMFSRPPAQAAQVDEKVVVIRDGQATTEGLVLAAAIYMGAVKDIFALRSDGPPYNERKVTKDDAALRAFDHLDAATKALRSAISHFASTADPATHPHSPDAADSGRLVDADSIAMEAAHEIALMWGQDRSQFVAKIQVRVIAAITTAIAAHGQGDRDAYEGARHDLLDWKHRALSAESTLRSLGYRGIVPTEPPASPAGVPDGIAIIAAERKRQIDKEGWSPAHDVAEYEGGELASAAACYAMPPEYKLRECTPPLAWPWEESWWKPGDRMRELAKAGALIAAEIDRLAAAPQPGESHE